MFFLLIRLLVIMLLIKVFQINFLLFLSFLISKLQFKFLKNNNKIRIMIFNKTCSTNLIEVLRDYFYKIIFNIHGLKCLILDKET